MADILEFRAAERQPDELQKRAGPGDIVIFPGVRIERDNLSLANRVSVGGARRNKVGNAKAED